jgi:hypothetical protein
MKPIHERRLATVISAPREVMANTPTDESRSRIVMLQSRKWSRLSLDSPERHSCYWKTTSESILTNQDGSRRGPNVFVIGWATTYSRGITTLKSKTTHTVSNHRTRCAASNHQGPNAGRKSQPEISRWVYLGRGH